MSIVIRPAVESDQSIIKSIVWKARIGPFGLRWPGFLVAEDRDTIIGLGQVKSHKDGSRELASIAVVTEYQGQGTGSKIIQELMARESGYLYLLCRVELEGYYERFGFHRVEGDELLPSLSKIHRRINRISRLISLFRSHPFQIISMKKEE